MVLSPQASLLSHTCGIVVFEQLILMAHYKQVWLWGTGGYSLMFSLCLPRDLCKCKTVFFPRSSAIKADGQL